MSLSITTDVFCECGDWVRGVSSHKVEGNAARRVAKSRGWERVRHGVRLVDVCPKCLGKPYEQHESVGMVEDTSPYAVNRVDTPPAS